MGNTPSVTGPDRGRLHVIRDDDSSVDSVTGQRPERLRVEETVAQLAEGYSDEKTNRKSNSLNVPESHTGYNITGDFPCFAISDLSSTLCRSSAILGIC